MTMQSTNRLLILAVCLAVTVSGCTGGTDKDVQGINDATPSDISGQELYHETAVPLPDLNKAEEVAETSIADVAPDAGVTDVAPDMGVTDVAPDTTAVDVGPDICVPDCAGKQCGPDGCDGICGVCTECGSYCNMFQCVPNCAPDCAGKVCGDDGCGCPCGECEEGESCEYGMCVSDGPDSLGTEFFVIDLDNYDDPFSDPDDMDHALAIVNPGPNPAGITYWAVFDGFDMPWDGMELPPQTSTYWPMTPLNVDGSVITNLSLRIQSDQQVGMSIFNPADPAGASNGSSLLFPADALGVEYLVLTWPTEPLEQVPIPNGPPSQHGYFTIIATGSGATLVTVAVTAATTAIAPDGLELEAGELHDFELQQFDVLQLQASGAVGAEPYDLSGSHISASQPVAVFAGHEEAVVEIDQNPDCCCADHVEEQLFPIDLWGTTHACVKAKPRGDSDKDTWRIQAGADDVQLTTTPPVPGLDGTTLAHKGDWVQVETAASFVLEASGPVQAMQYLAGGNCQAQQTGDPAMIAALPFEAATQDAWIHVPDGWEEHWATVVVAPQSALTLDGNPLQVPLSTIPQTEVQFAYVPLSAGLHQIAADGSMIVYLYGYSPTAAYGHPAAFAF